MIDHFHDQIDGWFYHADLFANLIPELPDDAEIVEVGSWKGKSAAFIGVAIINEDRGIQLTCVDTWEGSDEEAHRQDLDVQAGKLFDVFKTNTAPIASIMTPMKMESLKAAENFADMSIDLIYLDAAHDLENVQADIISWWPKLKPGGYMVGDDFKWPGVRHAVNRALGQQYVTFGDYPAWVTRKNLYGAPSAEAAA